MITHAGGYAANAMPNVWEGHQFQKVPGIYTVQDTYVCTKKVSNEKRQAGRQVDILLENRLKHGAIYRTRYSISCGTRPISRKKSSLDCSSFLLFSYFISFGIGCPILCFPPPSARGNIQILISMGKTLYKYYTLVSIWYGFRSIFLLVCFGKTKYVYYYTHYTIFKEGKQTAPPEVILVISDIVCLVCRSKKNNESFGAFLWMNSKIGVVSWGMVNM